MFGGFNPRVKGGLERLQQVFLAAAYWLKGPSESDFIISAGDRADGIQYGTSLTQIDGRALKLKGGASPAPFAGGTSSSQYFNGGAVVIQGADATSSTGLGYAVGNGGSVTITGGATGSSNGGSGGNVTVQGGNGYAGCGAVLVKGGNQVGGVNIQGGTATLQGGDANTDFMGGAAFVRGGNGGYAGSVTIQGGTPTNGTGGSITIKASNAVGSGNNGANVTISPGKGVTTGLGGNIQLDGGNGSALATSATSGFVTVPSMAGTPTGTPVNVPGGGVAMVVDTTDSKLWFYVGGAWKYAVLS